ncbi:MAG: YfiR family protein [Pseudomonadota bacterium]
MKRFIKLILIFLFIWFFAASITTAHSKKSQEDALLKVAFIYKFTKFVKWPGNIKNSPLVLCTMGEDKLVDIFSNLANDLSSTPKIQIQSITDNSAVSNCQVLYIASSERGRYRNIDSITRKKAVLTISELSGFMQAGGIIELIHKDNRIGFDINLDAAHINGLEISSRLLKLASKVKWDNKP